MDRAAYYQVATSSGLIRSRAVVTLRGGPSPPRAGRDDLRAARRRLTGLRPRSRLLRRLLRELAPGLRLALRQPLDRRAARRVLAISDRLNAGLKRHVREEPAASVLVPD